MNSEQPLDQLSRTFYCYTEDGCTVYPTIEDASGDKGNTKLQRVGLTLRPGEFFAVTRDENQISGTDNFLDYASAFQAARSEGGAGVAIMTPVSTEVTALSEHGQRIRIGFELSWTQRSLDPKPVASS